MDIESGGNIVLEIFKPSTLAPAALIVGIILVMFVKKSSVKGPGEICMGFGILFTGMMTMTNAVAPLAESQTFVDLLTRFSEMPVLEIIVGMPSPSSFRAAPPSSACCRRSRSRAP